MSEATSVCAHFLQSSTCHTISGTGNGGSCYWTCRNGEPTAVCTLYSYFKCNYSLYVIDELLNLCWPCGWGSCVAGTIGPVAGAVGSVAGTVGPVAGAIGPAVGSITSVMRIPIDGTISSVNGAWTVGNVRF